MVIDPGALNKFLFINGSTGIQWPVQKKPDDMKKINYVLMLLISAISIRGYAQCTGNSTPSITPSIAACGSGQITCVEGQTVTLVLLITDVNNDNVTLSTPDGTMLLPASATVSQTLPYQSQAPYSVTVTWTPVASEVHVSQPVRFRVTDPCTGTDCILEFFALDSCDNNNTPSVNLVYGICDHVQINGKIGRDTTFSIIVDDANHDIVTLSDPYANLQLPASAIVSPALPYTGQTPYTVTVTWTPAVSEYSVHQTVRWLVTDHCTGTTCDLRLFAECSVPTVTCPSTITEQASSPGCKAAVSYLAPATGLPAPVVSYQPPSGTLFNLGTTPVTVSATNTCGTTTCSFDVNVTPAPPPTVTCPGDISAFPSGTQCSAVVSYVVSAFSGVGLTSLDVVPPPGSTFNQGTTQVTATASNSCGTTNTCTFNVTVSSGITVNVGANVSTVFGYASTQTVTRTATVSGGTGPYTYSWSLSRPLKCNQVNSTGDELFSSAGGSCSNNNCPSLGSATPAAPVCTGSNTISATLLDGADVCLTVTDFFGCSATGCFHIDAVDGRCFTGNAGKNKTKICHRTGSATNPWVVICIAKSLTNAYLANHPNDILGPCPAVRLGRFTDLDNESFVVFPNPFSEETTIHFMSTEDTHAELEIYSAIGEKVASLYNGNITANDLQEVKLDGSHLSNGIYFCRLTMGSETYYEKIILSR